MGYWAGKDSQRFYVEGNAVFNRPGGIQLALDPVTFSPTQEIPAFVPEVARPDPLPVNVLEDFKDEVKVEAFVKEGKNVKPLEHAKECKSGGRWGRYTDGCPKCEFLKKAK